MKKIAVFLFEGAELFEIASFTDIFGWNNIVGLKEFRDIKVEMYLGRENKSRESYHRRKYWKFF